MKNTLYKKLSFAGLILSSIFVYTILFFKIYNYLEQYTEQYLKQERGQSIKQSIEQSIRQKQKKENITNNNVTKSREILKLNLITPKVKSQTKSQYSKQNSSSQNTKKDISTKLKPRKQAKGKATKKLKRNNILKYYSLQKYYKYITKLSTACKKNGLPDILIHKCFPNHVYLNLDKKHRLYLYYFLKMHESNLGNRYQAYEFFQEKCDFKAVKELTQLRIKNSANILVNERKRLIKLNLKLKDC